MSPPAAPPVGWVKPSRAILTATGRAIGEWKMIRDGDRILVGVSGGKDSLTLLHTLHHLQARAPVKFELLAATVDPQSDGFDPRPLIPYMAALGVRYVQDAQPIVATAHDTLADTDSFCAYCSRMRRGILYRIAREEGCNVLALAQHADDLAESLLMSMFFGGKLRTMQAHYLNDAGDLRVIRPFVTVRERQTRDFAAAHGLPVIFENCPACFSKPQQRYAMKQLLAEQEKLHPQIFASLMTAMKSAMGHPPA